MRDVFRTLRDPFRLNLYVILLQDELSLSELTTIFNSSELRIGEYLQTLENTNLIESYWHDEDLFFRARSYPANEARRFVLNHENNIRSDISRKVQAVKQKRTNNKLSETKSSEKHVSNFG